MCGDKGPTEIDSDEAEGAGLCTGWARAVST